MGSKPNTKYQGQHTAESPMALARVQVSLVPYILLLVAILGSCGTYGPYRDPTTNPASTQASNRSLGQPYSKTGTSSGIFSGSQAPDSVSFLVLSDIHGYDKESLVQSQATWNRHLIFWGKPQDTGFRNTKAVLDAAGHADLPDFIVLPGDMTVDGELVSHKMLQGVLDNFRTANPSVPVYVTTGNHDVNSPQARRHGRLFTLPTLSVSPGGFASIYDNYGFSQALSRDTESLSYVVEPVPGLALLMLDTASWHKNMFFPIRVSNTKGIIRESTLNWMEPLLAEARQLGMMIVVVQHHPLRVTDETEHQDSQKTDPINSVRTTALYQHFGVALQLAGHRHRLHLDLDSATPHITAPSLSSTPANAMLVGIGQDGVKALIDPYGFGSPELLPD